MTSQKFSSTQNDKILKILNPRRVIIPTLIGLLVVAYMIYTDDSFKPEDIISYFQQASPIWLFAALIALFIRDFFYIYRIRFLTNKQLSWKSSLYTIFLWEFSSAVSPSAVGGTAVASFLLHKEGLTFGKSLAYVMVSAILDNLFFIVFGGIVLALDLLGFFPLEGLFPIIEGNTSGLRIGFLVAFSVIATYNGLMMYGLFSKPRVLKVIFLKATSNRFLKRFRRAAVKQGNEVMIASEELKGFPFSYWANAVFSTIMIWLSRYFIVNCLVAGIVALSLTDHTFILSRHVVLWVILLVGVTPGAAGFAEYAFTWFFRTFSGDFTTIISILWRLVTYYPYLIIGVITLPRWLKRVFVDKPKSKESA